MKFEIRKMQKQDPRCGTGPSGTRQEKLDGGEEAGVGGDEAVGHAGGVEGVAGVAEFVEQDEAAGAFAAPGEELDGGLSGAHGVGTGGTKEVTGGFGEDDFHDGFAIAGGGNGAGFGVGVAAGADKRRIADTTGKLAARSAAGSGGEKTALVIESDGADGAVFMAAMVLGGVRVLAAKLPSFALGGRDERFGSAKGNALRMSEALGALGDEHHVGAFFEDDASGLNGISDAAETGDRAGAESGGVHHDGVALDVAIEIEVRAVAGVEDGIVFEDGDGGLDGVESVASIGEQSPASAKSSETTGLAGANSFVRNVPGATVDDERRGHG